MKNENTGFSYSSGKLLMVLHGKSFIGFAAYHGSEQSVILDFIYITPLYRRKGVALQLLQFLKHHESSACFNIDNANIDLIKLLIKAGFSFKVN